jgi:putative NADH-flavin reductase
VKLLIVGATGGAGKRLVKQMLHDGHVVIELYAQLKNSLRISGITRIYLLSIPPFWI